MDEDDWIAMTTFGSPYEERINRRTGEWQHQLLPLAIPRGMRHLLEDADIERPWTPGRAPE